MKRNWINVGLVIGITCLFFACHKYKEDKFISWKQPEKRILGTWHLTNFIVDGVDSTDNYLNTSPIICDITFRGDRMTNQSPYYCFTQNCSTINHQEYIEYSFNKNNIFIYWYFPCKSFNIIKLYNNDWWIQSEGYSKSYIIKFKKII